jgi:threonine dehydrogenase-like Zn-dependent dehydrogenase
VRVPATLARPFGRWSSLYDGGTEHTLTDALALAAGGGRLVLIGAAARVLLDLTRLWYRQLTLAGIFAYGMVPFRGQRRDIYEAAIELLREGALAELPLVTHRFALPDYRRAIGTALDKRGGVVKVVFRPGSAD